jgi:hypothetical protein
MVIAGWGEAIAEIANEKKIIKISVVDKIFFIKTSAFVALLI